MPSRKRRAGKARRVAAASAPSRIVRNGCTHGCPPAPPDDNHIMFQCWEGIRREIEAPGTSCALALMETALTFYEPVFHVTTLKTKFHQLLVAKGTSLLLNDEASNVTTGRPGSIADLILVVEDYDKQRGVFQQGERNMSTLQKIRDLHEGNDTHRCLTRFYARRIPCNCLLEQDSIAKMESKRGYCFHCKSVLERHQLQLCQGCQYAQYCSAKCQAADWPTHKKFCKKYASIHTVEPAGFPFHCTSAPTHETR